MLEVMGTFAVGLEPSKHSLPGLKEAKVAQVEVGLVSSSSTSKKESKYKSKKPSQSNTSNSSRIGASESAPSSVPVVNVNSGGQSSSGQGSIAPSPVVDDTLDRLTLLLMCVLYHDDRKPCLF